MRLQLAAVCLGGTLAIGLVWLLKGDPSAPQLASQSAAEHQGQGAKPMSSLVRPRIADHPPTNAMTTEGIQTQRKEEAETNKPARQEGTVVVLVRDANTRSPIDGVQLSIRPVAKGMYNCEPTKASVATPELCPETDANGRATFIVPLGVDYIVSTNDVSCGRVEQVVPAFSQPGLVDVLLEPPIGNDLRFVGRVVAAESGLPLADAQVSIQHSTFRMLGVREPDRRSVLESEVDALGFFEIQVPSWMQIVVKIGAPGRSQAFATVGPGHGDREHAVVVRLSRAATIDALVLGKAGAPLAMVEVRLTTPSYAINRTNNLDNGFIIGDILWKGVTDDRGQCTIEGLPSEVPLSLEYHRFAEFTRKQATPLILKAGERREIDFRLGSGGMVSGWLIEVDGSPACEAHVWLLPSDSTTPRYLRSHEESEARIGKSDGTGRFAFKDVADGHWLVGPSPEGPYAPRAEVVLVIDGAPGSELRLPAHKDLFIRGTVVDPTGSPVQGAFVSGRRESEWPATSDSPSNDGGHFILGPLVEGVYSVYAPFATGDLCPGEPVLVQAGTDNVLVQLLPGAGINGRVQDGLTGAPVEARIIAHPASVKAGGWGAGVRIVHADADGHFSLNGLTQGTYSVSAVSNRGLVAMVSDVEATPGVQDQRIALHAEPGAKVSIRYEGSESWAHYTVFSHEVIITMDGIRSGSNVECVVPSGQLRIECRWPGLGAPQVKELILQVGGQGNAVFGRQE